MILITGGAGYIGSHLNKKLHRQGKSTVVYDNLIYGHRDFVRWGNFVCGDLCDIICLDQVFSKYKIEAVVHFAAYAYVGESVENPSKYYRNNISNTLNLLDKMVEYKVPYIVFSSTCAIYGEPTKLPIAENCPKNPVNPYGRSKYIVEQILADYRRAYGINYCALRYFNAAGADPDGQIGELHNPETHLIPMIFDAALGKRRYISIFGDDYATKDGTCVRDYIHVDDLADAHILALEYIREKDTFDYFNLANGQGYSVNEIIEVAQKITGRKISIKIEPRRFGDPAKLIGSAEKAKRILGWQPNYGLEQIIETAWNWHKSR